MKVKANVTLEYYNQEVKISDEDFIKGLLQEQNFSENYYIKNNEIYTYEEDDHGKPWEELVTDDIKKVQKLKYILDIEILLNKLHENK